MAEEGYLAGRPAKQHYALVANEAGKTSNDVTRWLRNLCKKIETASELLPLLRSGAVEALFWIALFGEQELATPVPDQGTIDDVSRLNAKILFENYSVLSDGRPTKAWYPSTVV